MNKKTSVVRRQSLASVIKSEISRLSAREGRRLIKGLAERSTGHRSAIAKLKRQVAELKRKVFVLEKVAMKAPLTSVSAAKPIRFSAARLKARRTKLGLSAAQYAQLIGVSALSIYNWETGKARPRAEQIAKIGALRGMTKREALARLK